MVDSEFKDGWDMVMAAKKLEILQIDFSTDGIVKRDKVSCFHIIEPGRIHQFLYYLTGKMNHLVPTQGTEASWRCLEWALKT